MSCVVVSDGAAVRKISLLAFELGLEEGGGDYQRAGGEGVAIPLLTEKSLWPVS